MVGFSIGGAFCSIGIPRMSANVASNPNILEYLDIEVSEGWGLTSIKHPRLLGYRGVDSSLATSSRHGVI